MREETNLLNTKLSEQINIVDEFRDKYQNYIHESINKQNNSSDLNDNQIHQDSSLTSQI